jgi:hypothetical protein
MVTIVSFRALVVMQIAYGKAPTRSAHASALAIDCNLLFVESWLQWWKVGFNELMEGGTRLRYRRKRRFVGSTPRAIFVIDQ